MNICECGAAATEVCYRRGDMTEIWFCASKKHDERIRELSREGWLSQGAVAAASKTGVFMRRNLQGAKA